MNASLELAQPWRVAFAALFAVGVGVAASVDPRLAVVGAFGLGLVWLLFRNLTVALSVFAVLALFEETPGLGAVSLAKPVGVLLTLSWFLTLARGERRPLLWRDQPLLAAGVVAFVGWAAITSAWAIAPGAAVTGAVRIAQSMILFFIVFSVIRSARDLRIVLWSLVTGVVLTSAIGMVAGGSTEDGRLAGGLLDPNFLAAVVVLAMMISAFMLQSTASWRGRIVLIAYLAILAAALVLTESRGGLIALGVSLIAAICLGGRARGKILGVTMLVLAVGIGYYAILAPASTRARVSNVSAQSSAGRTDTWQLALRMASSHPVGGVGLANFPVASPSYVTDSIDLHKIRTVLGFSLVTHNTYLEVFAETGIVGLALFLSVIAGAMTLGVASVYRLERAGATDVVPMARGLVVGTIGLLVAYVFLSGEYEKQLWLALALVASLPTLASVATRAPAKRDEAGEPPTWLASAA